MGPMQWDGGNDPLESPYRAKELIYTGLANAKANQALESQMHAAANRGGASDPGAGQITPFMGGFAGAEASRQAARDSLSLGQTQQEAANWAGGRDIQHDRNLQNAEQERRNYDSQTARYVSDNQLRGQQALANGLNLGNALFQPSGAQPQATPGTALYGPGGQTIGGSGMGGALSGLARQPQPQQQQQRWR